MEYHDRAMKPGTLAIVSAVALGVVGYAAWTLMADPGRTKAARSRASTAEADDEEAEEGGKTRTQPKGGIARRDPTLKGDARRKPVGGPPPRPVPKVSLEKAREDFKAVLAEYDELLDNETVIDNKQWIDLYAKGADALTPLQQHLSWKVEAEAEELRTSQEAYREKINELQRQVSRPPSPH